jgi:hypothetical protein
MGRKGAMIADYTNVIEVKTHSLPEDRMPPMPRKPRRLRCAGCNLVYPLSTQLCPRCYPRQEDPPK